MAVGVGGVLLAQRGYARYRSVGWIAVEYVVVFRSRFCQYHSGRQVYAGSLHLVEGNACVGGESVGFRIVA